MIVDATIVAQSRQQEAQVIGLPLADGLGAGRLEPIVDPAHWAAGMHVPVWASVIDRQGDQIGRWEGTLSASVDRAGNPISSSLSILAPFPSAGFALDAGVNADRVSNLGLRLTAAPDPSQLPAPLAPPGGP